MTGGIDERADGAYADTPMVKQKTRKAAAKRFVMSKRGTVLRRYAMQDHFNVGRSKKVLRSRRRDRTLSAADRKRLTRLLPFRAPPLSSTPSSR